MLVMDVAFSVMQRKMASPASNLSIYVLEHSTHWEFYADESSNVVLRSRKEKLGPEPDAIFRASGALKRTIKVQSIVWGKHVANTSLLQETRDEAGHSVNDIAPDVPKAPPTETELKPHLGDDELEFKPHDGDDDEEDDDEEEEPEEE